MDKQQLTESMGMSTVKVTFTKLNGETRVMLCTRNWDEARKSPSWVEPAKHDDDEATSTTAVRVWDIENNAWRSIRPESVQSVENA